MSRARAFVFTLNNYKDTDEEHIKGINCRYLVYGREVAPTTGTEHLQGYIYFDSQKTFSAVKKLFKNDKIHIEVAKGNGKQNREYCVKDNSFFEKGEMPNQGKRSDIDVIRDTIKDGGNIREVVETAQSYQAVRIAEKYLTYHEKPRNYKPTVVWYYGETGCGKTKRAYEELGEDLYVATETAKWWDGYDGHEKVLIDDMRRDFIKFHNLLKLLDRYQFRVEVKGGYRQFKGKHIIITCPYHPADLYKKSVEDVAQLLRRIDKIEYLGDMEEDAYRNKNNSILYKYSEDGFLSQA